MDKVIAWTQKKIEGTVILPASKSESNRALVLSALAGGGMPENLSDSDDTRVLAEALKQAGGLVDVGHAGTSMRFLAACLAGRGVGINRIGTDEATPDKSAGGGFMGIGGEDRIPG